MSFRSLPCALLSSILLLLGADVQRKVPVSRNTFVPIQREVRHYLGGYLQAGRRMSRDLVQKRQHAMRNQLGQQENGPRKPVKAHISTLQTQHEDSSDETQFLRSQHQPGQLKYSSFTDSFIDPGMYHFYVEDKREEYGT